MAHRRRRDRRRDEHNWREQTNTGATHRDPEYLAAQYSSTGAGAVMEAKKPNSLMPMIFLIVLVVASVGIGILLIYFIGSQFTNMTNNPDKITAVISTDTKTTNLNVIFFDRAPSMKNPKTDKWEKVHKGPIPAGVEVLTDALSKRNIFSVNNVHTIRVTDNTRFEVVSEKSTDNFSKKIEMILSSGNVWLETAGDLFEVHTERGMIVSKGADFQVRMLPDKSVKVYAWKKGLEFKHVNKKRGVIKVKQGEMLYVDSAGIPIKTDLESRKTKWQKWNLATRGADVLTGSLKPWPGTAAYASRKAGKTRSKKTSPVRRRKTYKARPRPSYSSKTIYTNRPSTNSYKKAPSFGGTTSYPKAPTGGSYPKAKKKYKSPTYVKKPNYTPKYTTKPRAFPRPTSAAKKQKDPPKKTSSSSGNPLENKRTLNRVPGTGIGDKPVGPPGGYGVPYQ